MSQGVMLPFGWRWMDGAVRFLIGLVDIGNWHAFVAMNVPSFRECHSLPCFWSLAVIMRNIRPVYGLQGVHSLVCTRKVS